MRLSAWTSRSGRCARVLSISFTIPAASGNSWTEMDRLWFSKLDSFNSLYSGLPVCQIMKLQRVQNAAGRLVLGIPRCEHITPDLKSLHWLPVEKRIVFKLCLLVYKTRLHRICVVCFFHMHRPDN